MPNNRNPNDRLVMRLSSSPVLDIDGLVLKESDFVRYILFLSDLLQSCSLLGDEWYVRTESRGVDLGTDPEVQLRADFHTFPPHIVQRILEFDRRTSITKAELYEVVLPLVFALFYNGFLTLIELGPACGTLQCRVYRDLIVVEIADISLRRRIAAVADKCMYRVPDNFRSLRFHDSGAIALELEGDPGFSSVIRELSSRPSTYLVR